MHSSPKGHKEKRNGQVYDSQVLEEVHSMPEGEAKAGCRLRRAHAFIGVLGIVLCGS